MTMKLFEFCITSGPPVIVVTLAVDGMPQIWFCFLRFSEFCKKSQLQLIWQLEKIPTISFQSHTFVAFL